MQLAEIYRNIKNFIVKYSSKAITTSVSPEENELSKGLYIEAFAYSMDTALSSFRSRMLKLEKIHIENTHLPLNYFLREMKEFETLFLFLKQLLNEIKQQRIHGCTILGVLHKYNFHTDPISMQALKIMRSGVYAVFLRQLSQWLIYGRLVDNYQEFFIAQNDITGSKESNIQGKTVSIEHLSESTDKQSRLWQYELVYPMIPPNFTITWAEKVLFIGRTVRMLNENSRKNNKQALLWSDDDEYLEIGALWNKQEHVYFNKIQNLHNHDSIESCSYEMVINEIKLSVTELVALAFSQADLIKHLKLIKDYYLLERGELFLEFIIELNNIRIGNGANENLARDVNHAFQKALSRTPSDGHNDLITMHLHDEARTDCIEKTEDILKLVQLKFNAKWPLHLLFSPKAQIHYNELFRFMLQVRHIQNELHNVWRLHREKKLAGNSAVSQLRNKMLFFIDHFMYYLHDVIESQFCTLLNAVLSSKNFEFIERAHCIFQTNLMSLTFLLNAELNKSNSEPVRNSVHTTLIDIFNTIRKFCYLNESLISSTPAESSVLTNTFEKQ